MIIEGGATILGIALDEGSRGLKPALVVKRGFAKGIGSKSGLS